MKKEFSPFMVLLNQSIEAGDSDGGGSGGTQPGTGDTPIFEDDEE